MTLQQNANKHMTLYAETHTAKQGQLFILLSIGAEILLSVVLGHLLYLRTIH